MNISLPVVVRVLKVPEGFVPPNTMQGLLVTIPEYLRIRLPEEGPVMQVAPTPPTDTTGAWVEMQTSPTPTPATVKVYYNGVWRQVYSGQPGEVQIFVGDPSTFFDVTGLGIVGDAWDGWALCNGANGTTDLRGLFVIPGYAYYTTTLNPGGPAVWLTNVGTYLDGSGPGMIGGSGDAGMKNWQANTLINLNSGGFVEFKIGLWNLPFLNLFFDFNGGYDSGTGNSTAPTNPGGGNMGTVTIPFTNQAEMVNTPINRLPPYVAEGYVQFVGYA